jgi:hypothetical protein
MPPATSQKGQLQDPRNPHSTTVCTRGVQAWGDAAQLQLPQHDNIGLCYKPAPQVLVLYYDLITQIRCSCSSAPSRSPHTGTGAAASKHGSWSKRAKKATSAINETVALLASKPRPDSHTPHVSTNRNTYITRISIYAAAVRSHSAVTQTRHRSQ